VKTKLTVKVDEIESRRVNRLGKPSRLLPELFDPSAAAKRIGRYSDDVVSERVGRIGQKRSIFAHDVDPNSSSEQAAR
jgi:hypothetical protein